MDNHGLVNANLNEDVVERMVDVAVREFAAADSVDEAWESIIPDPTATVAIKVNCQITGIYTKSAVVGLLSHDSIHDSIVALCDHELITCRPRRTWSRLGNSKLSQVDVVDL